MAGPSPSSLRQIRASQLKASVRAFEELGAAAARTLHERRRPLVAQGDETIGVTWLPLGLDIELSGTLAEVAGISGLRRVARGSVERSAEGPLLGPFRRALLSLGLTPNRALSRAPYAWPHLYRRCGAIRVDESGPGRASMTHLDVPEEMRAPTSYLDGIAGGFEGVIAVGGGKDPHVEVVRDGRDVRYLCSWS